MTIPRYQSSAVSVLLLVAVFTVLVVFTASSQSLAGDCDVVPCVNCATVGPDVQPPDTEIVVFFDPTEASADLASAVANGLRGGFDFVEFPWQFSPACSNRAACFPTYPVHLRGDFNPLGKFNVQWLLELGVDGLADPSQTAESIESVMFHEWFHWIQLCHYRLDEYEVWGQWLIEGTASCMSDTRTSAVDSAPDSDFLTWAPSFNLSTGLLYSDYQAALWWKYFSEQLGVEHAEPARGVNAIRQYFDLMTPVVPPDPVAILRAAIQTLGSDRSFEELLRDFAIANFIKHLDLSAIDFDLRDRYRYFDETPEGGGTIYPSASAPGTQSDFGFDLDLELDSEPFWSGHYFEAQADDVADCTAIGMRGSTGDDREAYWVVMAIDEGETGLDRVARIISRRGSTFHHTFLTNAENRFTKLVGIAILLGRSGGLRVAFGLGQPQVEIDAPTEAHPICVPPGERFGVEVRVAGPDTLTAPGPDLEPSLSGLTAEDFALKLVSANNPQNEFPLAISFVHRVAAGTYAITTRVPDEIDPAVDGEDFDLVVCVCPAENDLCGGDVTREDNALKIGDFLTHQMIALDVSGSMGFESKLDAARNMVGFLVNSSGPSNLLGLVAFSGNGTEAPPFGQCDNDAKLIAGLADMSVSQNRFAILDAIAPNQLSAEGFTSVGDGLLEALGELLNVPEPPDKKRIMLLTDGMENEPAFWEQSFSPCSTSPVMQDFDSGSAGDDIQIHSRGFGNDADMDLLGRISALTGGHDEAVPTDAQDGTGAMALAPGGGAGGGGITPGPDPMTLNVSNRLAESFRQIQEDALGLDRLFYASVVAGTTPTDVVIPMAEAEGGGVREAAFGFNWAAGSEVTVALRDENGVLITGGTPGWSVRTPPGSAPQTSVVYHFDGVLAAQEYSATISATSPTQVICLLSGKLREGVDTEMEVEPTLSDTGFCKRRYSRGYPVRVWLTAAGAESGLAGLEPVAVIRNPDGSINRRTLFDDGNHDDGEAGDGIYANTYPRTSFARGSFSGMADTEPPALDSNLGTYSVTVLVSGENEFGESFTRYESATFTVIEHDIDFQCIFDADEDGMADRWETLVGLDPADPTDADRDEDDDGVINIAEFHAGTHPFNPDTDRGGESDGSELAAGRDPLWEQDDQIIPIQDYGVVRGGGHIGAGAPTAPGTLRLRFPASQGYQTMHVYRSDKVNPVWSDFTEVGTIDVHNASPRGLYNDVGLADHTKVHYYLRAEGLSSVFTAPSDIFSATPPPPELSTPGGSLRLNCGGPLVVDSAGRTWQPDAPYLFRAGTSTSTTAAPISDAPLSDPDVPQNALRASRTGESRYDITVPNGDYLVTLYFSENCPACVAPALGGSGCSTCIRRFGVDVEGQRLEVNPADAAIGAPADGNGAVFRATEVSFDIRVLDQRIDIDLEDLGNGSSFGDPVIQAIAIENLNPLTLSRGDCNGDGTMDLSDAFKLIGYLFFGDPAPPCLAACDSNGDGLVGGSVADIVYLLIHLFNAGPPPPPPGSCGPATPGDVQLGCASPSCP